MSQKNKRVIITAAADGIGKVIAEQYLKLGAKVAVCDIQEDKVKAFAAEHPDNLLCEVCNVGDDKQLEAWLDNSLKFLGGCDTLINNAGIGGPTANIEDISMDDVRAVMDAVGSERASLLGISEGGPMCLLYPRPTPSARTR